MRILFYFAAALFARVHSSGHNGLDLLIQAMETHGRKRTFDEMEERGEDAQAIDDHDEDDRATDEYVEEEVEEMTALRALRVRNRPICHSFKFRPMAATDAEARYLLARFRLDERVDLGRLFASFRARFPDSRLTEQTLESHWMALTNVGWLEENAYSILLAHANEKESAIPKSITQLRAQMNTPRNLNTRKLMLWYDHVIARGEMPLIQIGLLKLTPAQYRRVETSLMQEVMTRETREQGEQAVIDHCLRDQLAPLGTRSEVLQFAMRLMQTPNVSGPLFWRLLARVHPNPSQGLVSTLNKLLRFRCVSSADFERYSEDPSAHGATVAAWCAALEESAEEPVRLEGEVCLTDAQYFAFLEKLRLSLP